MRKDKVNLESGCKDRNSIMKNFCQQKGLYRQQQHYRKSSWCEKVAPEQ